MEQENGILITCTTMPKSPLDSRSLWDISAPSHIQITVIRDYSFSDQFNIPTLYWAR